MVHLCPLLGRLSSFIPGNIQALTNIDFEISGHGQVLNRETFSDTVPLHTDILVKDFGSCIFLYQLKYPRKGLLGPNSQAQRSVTGEAGLVLMAVSLYLSLITLDPVWVESREKHTHTLTLSLDFK